MSFSGALSWARTALKRENPSLYRTPWNPRKSQVLKTNKLQKLEDAFQSVEHQILYTFAYSKFTHNSHRHQPTALQPQYVGPERSSLFCQHWGCWTWRGRSSNKAGKNQKHLITMMFALQGNKVATLASLGKEWKITFNLKLSQLPTENAWVALLLLLLLLLPPLENAKIKVL